MADKPKVYGIRLLPLLTGIALVCLLGAAVLFFLEGAQPGRGVEDERRITQLVALAQKMPTQAASALSGNAAGFDALTQSQTRYGELAKALAGELQGLEASADLLKHTQAVLSAREAMLGIHQAAADVRTVVPQLLQALGNVASNLGPQGVEAMARHLERFEVTGLRLEQDMQALAGGIGDAQLIARRLADGIDYMGQVVGGLGGEDSGLGVPRAVGTPAEGRLRAVNALYTKLSEQVRTAITSADRVRAAHEAAVGLAGSADQLYSRYESRLGLGRGPVGALGGSLLPLALLGIAALSLILLVVLYAMGRDVRKAMELQVSRTERNQEAILRLLDELSSLADGDLTVQATVTEDITGAIADSINYAIEALRELVATINDTAITLDASAKQTLASVGHLAKASVAQSRQVALASESIAAMAGSTEEVSGNAERAADVARHSVDVAHKGGDAVRRTIDGMNAIRETIQETSKRIKRLGESSQEIGNIVELINDIAEQTNILALNASIQASMAGEAGRGFAVVADEVQRLAERAANATKQIEVLVRTIQADTNEAVVSMERSTTDVVGGALLAENAGAALEEIEQVSNQIASLVQNISASSRQQASAAQDIARNMGVLREISAQTAENSAATSNSVGKLAELSAQLRESVSGFRLPDGAGSAAPQDAALEAVKPSGAAAPANEPKKVSSLR